VKTISRHSLPTTVAGLLAFLLVLAPAVHGDAGVSNILVVDTRGSGELTVTGRVLDRGSNLGLAGASIALAGRSTTTDAAGNFSLANVHLASGTSLSGSKAGYLSQTQTVSAPTGAKSVSVGDMALASNTTKPVVDSVSSPENGLLLTGFGIVFNANAHVNWNGNTPGSVAFKVNGRQVASPGGSGPDYSVPIDVDTQFTPSLLVGKNNVTVVATTSGGVSSDPFVLKADVIPVPESLRVFMSNAPTGSSGVSNAVLESSSSNNALGAGTESKYNNGSNVGLKFIFPDPKLEKTLNLPVLGPVGMKLQTGGEFKYTLKNGEYEFEIGAGGAEVQRASGLVFGNTEIGIDMGCSGKGAATRSEGITLTGFSLYAGLSYEQPFEIARWYILDLLGPPGTLLARLPGLTSFLQPLTLAIWATPGISGRAYFDLSPEVKFSRLELGGKIPVQAGYNPDLNIATLKVYVGGEPSVAFQVPGDLVKSVGFILYAGLEAKAWSLVIGPLRYVFLDYSYPASPPAGAARRLQGAGYLVEAAGNTNATWKPEDRSYRNAGTERFLAGSSAPARRLSTAQNNPALDLFCRMGNAPSPGAVYTPPAPGPARRIASDPSLPPQVSLPLLSNVYPDGKPALASRGSNLMLLYVRDTGVQNAVQFTEIAFTAFDGSSWSTPAAVAANPRGQFEPKVTFDGNGNAVAVWVQTKDPSFTGTDIVAMAEQMEIMTSTWSNATQTWSAATALTSNSFLDHQPQLAGPLTNGDVLLSWVQNPGNQMMGSGASGAPENDRVMTMRWNCATATWGSASTLLDNLSTDLSHSFAAAGNKAVYVWSQDQDGDLNDFSDTELYYRIWNETAGTWGTATRYTNDAVSDRNARVVVGSPGFVYVVWQHGNDLVMGRNLTGVPSSVRADSTGMGFADFSVALGPGANVIVLWEEMASAGPDAHYRVFDPMSNTWGLDTLLSNDSDLEHSFATVWDAMGNLVLAYNNVEMVKQTVSVPLDGGGTIDVPGVPLPGQAELSVARRALVKDLSLAANSLTAAGTTFLAGDTIALTAKVSNCGNLAVQDVQVGFYDGDPQAGGTLIQTVTLPGWLKAADALDATTTWTLPSPSTEHTVYAVVDPAAQVMESDKTNNTQSLALNGADLELQYLSGSVSADGAVHVVVQVTNIGAPASQVTTLKLWPKENPGTVPLAAMPVSLLDPGDFVQIALDLPPGSQSEGDFSYRITVDEDSLSGDIDITNNEVLFAINLFVSTASDGIPDSWKRQYGFSTSDSAVTNADSDGDGFTNYQEYLCGTNPRDSSSKLKIGDMNVTMQPDGKSAQFTISWVPVSDRFYTVERSFDLKTWTSVGTKIPAASPLNSYTDNVTFPDGGKKCFYRVRLE
jgi:hypothetical protein